MFGVVAEPADDLPRGLVDGMGAGKGVDPLEKVPLEQGRDAEQQVAVVAHPEEDERDAGESVRPERSDEREQVETRFGLVQRVEERGDDQAHDDGHRPDRRPQREAQGVAEGLVPDEVEEHTDRRDPAVASCHASTSSIPVASRCENLESASAVNSSRLPNSATAPSSRMRMSSARLTVVRRWAIRIPVLFSSR